MRLCLIVNPKAGQAKPENALPHLRELLSAWTSDLTIHTTDARGAGERIARGIGPGEFDGIVAAGGDGTINEVLNGLADHTPLGILPLGTANVLARELKIPVDDLPAACAIIRDCPPRPIDLGLCSGRRFSLMAGIGFDAESVREVPPNVKDLIGAPAYVLGALRAFSQLSHPMRYRLRVDGRRRVARGMMLVAANAASYAGPFRIATEAAIDDGCLDLCLFRERTRLELIGQLALVLLGRQRDDPHFTYQRARTIRVECRPPASVQLDGDYFGRTPVEISILPSAIRVCRPE